MSHPILDSLRRLYGTHGELWLSDRGELLISHPYTRNDSGTEHVNYYDEPNLYALPDRTDGLPYQSNVNVGAFGNYFSHWQLARVARACLQYLLCEGSIDPAWAIHQIYACADTIEALTQYIDANVPEASGKLPIPSAPDVAGNGIIPASKLPEPEPDPIPF